MAYNTETSKIDSVENFIACIDEVVGEKATQKMFPKSCPKCDSGVKQKNTD